MKNGGKIERKRERERDRKKKEQESAEAISGLKKCESKYFNPSLIDSE